MTKTQELTKGQRYNVACHAGGGVVDGEFRGRFGTDLVFKGPDGRVHSFQVIGVREIVPAL